MAMSIVCSRTAFTRTRVASVGRLAFASLHSSRRALAGVHVEEASDKDFAEKVIKSTTPVIVDFYADWCGPCRMLTPVLEKVVEAQNGAVKLVKVNVDDNPDVSHTHKVSSIPLVVGYANGKVVDQFTGVRDATFVSTFIDRLKVSTQ